MRIVVAGGSGLLGRALVAASVAAGDTVTVLSRAGASRHDVRVVAWTPDGRLGAWADHLRGADAVVNLAGSSIAAGRWTRARKARILESRLLATRSLVEGIGAAGDRPPAMLSASAVGAYGTSDDRRLAEDSPTGRGFLAEVCVRWEEEARRAERCGARVVSLRSGLVLSADGGVLPRMALPFRFFAGGRIGSGSQYVSWIHIRDWVGLTRLAIGRLDLSGPMNLTAPAPAANREFSAAVGRALRRPSWVPVPATALRLLFGEMADEMLLAGQRVMPDRALALGYRFTFPDLDSALRDLLGAQ